jgi:hypothetical protein
VEGKLIQRFEGLDVGDQVRVKLIGTDVERGFIDFARAGNNGQVKPSKFNYRINGYIAPREWGALLKINRGAQQLTIRYQGFFPARPQRQSLRSGGSGLLRTPINII